MTRFYLLNIFFLLTFARCHPRLEVWTTICCRHKFCVSKLIIPNHQHSLVYSKYYILLVYTSYAITFTYVLFGPGIISVRKWELRDRDLEFRLFDGNGNFKMINTIGIQAQQRSHQQDGWFLSISKMGSHQQNNRLVYMYRSDNIPRVQSSHSTTNSPCVYLQKDLTSAATASTSLYKVPAPLYL